MKSDFINDLVSIIVPAYNVELFIESCLKSILNQDYEKLEVIVINDGSTDSSLAIIREISKLDYRVRVLDSENSGVSSARNKGMAISRGEYLIFVDGDDYLSTDYISYMLNVIKETNSDFTFSTNCYTKKGEKQVNNDCVRRINSEDATTLLLSPDVVVGCWNKMYKRGFLIDSNLKFSEKLFYGEGLTFIIEASQATNNIGVGNRKVYHYRTNNDNSATTKFDIEKVYNGEKALIGIRDNLQTDSRKVQNMFNYHLSLFRLGAIVNLIANNIEEDYQIDYKRWLDYIRNNALRFLSCNDLSLYRKVLILVGCVSPRLMAMLDIIRRRRKFKNSVIG
ncbi:glycosyltransferase family 2 protein [Vibrio cyclitrophicus]